MVDSLFTGVGEGEPTAELSRCKTGSALTSRSFTAERDHQVSLRKQIAASTAPVYRKSDDVADVFARAWAFHQSGQFAEARVGYKKVLKKRPNHFHALHLLGASEHQRGDFEAALRPLKRALLLDPRSAQVQCDLAIVLAALQRHDEALACFGKLITMQGDFIEAHYHQGNVLLGLGRLAEAIVSFDNAIALNSQHVNALTQKGHALHLLGRFAEAIMCYDKVLVVKPAHVPALVNRGTAFKDLRQADKAIAEFNLALAIDPGSIHGWINRDQTGRRGCAVEQDLQPGLHRPLRLRAASGGAIRVVAPNRTEHFHAAPVAIREWSRSGQTNRLGLRIRRVRTSFCR